MKVYVVWYQEMVEGYAGIENIFSSEEKAKEYILESYPYAIYIEDIDTYINDDCHYEIREWEVK